MPSDETRRLLRTFGVAVTQFEDAVSSGAPANEIKQAEDEARPKGHGSVCPLSLEGGVRVFGVQENRPTPGARSARSPTPRRGEGKNRRVPNPYSPCLSMRR